MRSRPNEQLTESHSLAHNLKRNFILQQGLSEPATETCPLQYSALLFQPRVVGLVLLAASILREPLVFIALGGILWWSAIAPRLNPFDALYNRTLAHRPGGIRLAPAPAPRRFAQGLAGSLALAIGASLMRGWYVTAFVIDGLLLAAVAALVFGGFCFDSFAFHLLRGRAAFVRRTLPWSRSS